MGKNAPADFKEFFRSFILSDSLPILLPSKDGGKLVWLSKAGTPALSVPETTAALKILMKYRAAELDAFGMLLPDTHGVKVMTMGKKSLNTFNSQLLGTTTTTQSLFTVYPAVSPHACKILPVVTCLMPYICDVLTCVTYSSSRTPDPALRWIWRRGRCERGTIQNCGRRIRVHIGRSGVLLCIVHVLLWSSYWQTHPFSKTTKTYAFFKQSTKQTLQYASFQKSAHSA